jgi:hypothetical protein
MDVEGKRAVPVREDRIIRTIRTLKRALNVAQNNELYVCESCMQTHLERRRSFEKTMLFASVFAGLIFLVILIVPLLSGRIDPWGVVSGFIVAGFVLLLPIFKYAPAVEGVSASTFAQPAKPLPAAPLPPAAPPPTTPASGQEKKPEEKPRKKAKSKK